MRKTPFPVYDADSHLYEPEEAFTRHLPEALQARLLLRRRRGTAQARHRRHALRVHPEPDVRRRRGAGLAREVVPRRQRGGAHAARALRKADQAARSVAHRRGAASRSSTSRASTPRSSSRRSRRRSRSGSARAPPRPPRSSTALNQWTVDEWGFAREDRLFSVPFISLTDVDLALGRARLRDRERRAHGGHPPGAGARGLGSRSFGFEEYDPFWARVADAGLFVCLHASDSGYDRVTQWWTGGQGEEFLAFERNSFQAMIDLLGRAISDSIAALICHGVFERHPARARGCDRERRGVGAAPPRAPRPRLRPDAERLQDAPARAVRAPRLRRAVLRGRRRRAEAPRPGRALLFGSDFPHPGRRGRRRSTTSRSSRRTRRTRSRRSSAPTSRGSSRAGRTSGAWRRTERSTAS